MAPRKDSTLWHLSSEERPLRPPPRVPRAPSSSRSVPRPRPTTSSMPKPKPTPRLSRDDLHKHERAWEEKYRAAHANEREVIARARQEPPRRTAADPDPRPARASAPRPSSASASASASASQTGSAQSASAYRVGVRGTKSHMSPAPDLPVPDLIPVPKAPPSLLSGSPAEGGYLALNSTSPPSPPPPASEPSPSSSNGTQSPFSPSSRRGPARLRNTHAPLEPIRTTGSALSLSRMDSTPTSSSNRRVPSLASSDAAPHHRLSRLKIFGHQEPESHSSDSNPARSHFFSFDKRRHLNTSSLPSLVTKPAYPMSQGGTYTAPQSPSAKNSRFMGRSPSGLSGNFSDNLQAPFKTGTPSGHEGKSSWSVGLTEDDGDYTSEGFDANESSSYEGSSDTSDWNDGPAVKWSPYQAQIESRLVDVDRHQGQGGKREVGDVLLLGPAAAVGSSRRPPEYDTGGMKGKESKITWAPWKLLTRGTEDGWTNSAEDEVLNNSSSLAVHARFAVYAVSGPTVVTAHNHKVKIFRSGTVRAEVTGLSSSDPRTPLSAAGSTTFLPGTSPSAPEKVATIQDPDMAMEGRVTALCLLRPCGNEESARYAWVGTRSGMLWELDVVKEVRTAVNRTVHKLPIVRIARLGDRILVVDEGGKMSIWTPPAPPGSEAPAHTSMGGRSSLSVNIARDSLETDDTTSIRSSRPPSIRDKAAADKSFESSSSTRLLNTRPVTQRFPVEGKTCVPLLVGNQLWVATGGAVLGSYHASEPGSIAQGSGHKHTLSRSIRKSMRSAASHMGGDHTQAHGAPTLRDIRLYIFNPFADEQPSTAPSSPPLLPAVVAGTVIGPVTAAAVVPCSPSTVFLSHLTGHISEWSRTSYQCVTVHQNAPEPILCMTAAGRYLWAGTKSGKIVVYGLSEQTKRSPGCRLVMAKSWVAHGGNPVTRLVTDPDGVAMGRLQVVSGGMDGAVRTWDGLLTHDWFERRLIRARSDVATSRTIRTLHVTYNIDAADPGLLRSSRAGPENRDFLQDLLRSAGVAPPVTYDTAEGEDVKPVGPEIIVFGLQELIDLEDKRLTAKSLLLSKKRLGNDLGERISHQYAAWRTTLVTAVAEAFGEGKYKLVEAELMVGLMTCVFVSTHEVKAGNLAETAVGTVKTGLGGRYGNKGAVAARVVLDDTSLCFVNCHLAAGQSHIQARNNDAATILGTTKLFPKSAAAASTLPPGPNTGDGPLPPGLCRTLAFTRGGDGEQIFDHEVVFWSGDLNYRINLSRDETLAYLKSGNLAALRDADQLGEQCCGKANFALRAFYETPISFPPTYKYNHGSKVYDTSAKQRVPAWCDRILWCDAAQTFPSSCMRIHDAIDDEEVENRLGPLHPHKNPLPQPRPKHVVGYAYRAWSPTISDHRPVSSQFEVKVERIDQSRLAKLIPRLRQEWALVQAHRLEEAKQYYETSILG